MGGAGLYAIPTIMCFELVPLGQREKEMGVVSAVFVMSYVLGPLIGGAISNTGRWRWVFLLKYDFLSSLLYILTAIGMS